jgi:hypothetical protein
MSASLGANAGEVRELTGVAAMISVLIPTRRHLDKLPRAVRSLQEHASVPIEILLGIDDDDPDTIAWARPRRDVRAVVSPRPDTLGAVTNGLAAAAQGDVLLCLADDMEILTPRWDVEIGRVAVRESADGKPFAFYLDDPTHPGFPSVWGVNRSWVDICGFACAPWFPYWWGDTWIMEVGMASGRLFSVPVLTGQIEGRGMTTGMREVAWWAAFFEKTRPLRMQMAEAISAAAYLPDVHARLQDVRPQVALEFARMQAELQANNRATVLEAALSAGGMASERYVRAKAAAARLIGEENDAPDPA